MAEAIGKHETEDSKGIKAHFRMDESGLLNLETVEAVFEAKVESDADVVGNIVGDAISKFGESISKLFGRTDDEADVEKVVFQSNYTLFISNLYYISSRMTPNRRRLLVLMRRLAIRRQPIQTPLLQI